MGTGRQSEQLEEGRRLVSEGRPQWAGEEGRSELQGAPMEGAKSRTNNIQNGACGYGPSLEPSVGVLVCNLGCWKVETGGLP